MNGSPRQWSKHYRDVWEERSGDPNLPAWLRVASLAYGLHKANGHAVFRRGSRTYTGDLALTLGSVNHATGEITPATSDKIRNAVDSAVKYGWLAPGSNAGCLIVPGHAVEYNAGGNPHTPCSVNHETARARHARQAAVPVSEAARTANYGD